jgi:hypothetical protein
MRSDQQAKPDQSHQKIGQGHLQAWARAGLKELAQILPATSESIKPVEEYGLFGTALPQEVFEQKNAQGLEMERQL